MGRCAGRCERELLAAGLAERRREPFLLVFSRERLARTAAGEERAAAVRSGLDRAAAGQLAAAGALVLLLEAQVLEQARRRAGDGGTGGGSGSEATLATDGSDDVDATVDPGDFGGVDVGSVDIDIDAGDFGALGGGGGGDGGGGGGGGD
jgi:hypothetical protein